jgi:hypothetical protein
VTPLAVGAANARKLPLVWILVAIRAFAPARLAPGSAGVGSRRQRGMACRAVKLAVLPGQFKAGKRGVIEAVRQRAERRGVMATRATVTTFDCNWHEVSIKDTFVRIAMTGAARNLAIPVLRNATKSPPHFVGLFTARMTVGAVDLAMRAIDHETRPIVVIESSMIQF